MSKPRRIAHAIGLATLVFTAACATRPPTGTLDALEPEWLYLPGPATRLQATGDGERLTRVSAETDRAWTVTIGDPPTTIAVERLPDGRPATTLIAEPARNETAVFDPPLALVPRPGLAPPATETADVALYKGLYPQGVPAGVRPTRTGTAERHFLAVERETWRHAGRDHPAQRLHHELVLRLGPVQIRQLYDSLAVKDRGIVDETMTRRISVLGVTIQNSTETARTIDR